MIPSPWIVLYAIVIYFFLVMVEKPLDIAQLNKPTIDASYNIVELSAPALSGVPLAVFTYIATKTWLRPYIIRHFLNQNGIESIRQLAAHKKYANYPPMYYPMVRLRSQEYQTHEQYAQEEQGKDYTDAGTTITNTQQTQRLYRSVLDYHNLYKSGKATPLDVIQQFLEGYDKLQHLKVWASFDKHHVLQQAQASTLRWQNDQSLGLWDGVPYAVKDMIHAVPHKICYGGQTGFCNPTPSTSNDRIVENFQQRGAIMVGITTMPEGGVTPLGYSVWFKGPFNPYNPSHYPGGSSSGSAVAVASGLVPVAVGFDGGGSIRVPASMSGVLGLATTFGRVPFASDGLTNTKAGPLAATVYDTALAYHTMSQRNNDDSTPPAWYDQLYDGGIRGTPPVHLKDVLTKNNNIRGMRMGVYWDHFSHTDPEVLECCNDVLRFFEQQGAILVNMTIPHLKELHLSHGIKILSEFAMNWDRPFFDPSIQLEPNTDIMLALGRSLLAAEVLAAERMRGVGLRILREELFGGELQLDAIVSPTLGLRVPSIPKSFMFEKVGESNTPLVYKTMRFIPLANFLGLPGMSVPVGYDSEKLPIGFQLLGDSWHEHKLLRIAAVMEEKFVQRRRPPPENFFDPLAKWLE